MSRINFFEDSNKQITNKKEFGLRDDRINQPAYIDDILSNKIDKWFGTVKNSNELTVAFFPVDHCVTLKRTDGSDASRCEGILRYDGNKLIFTELKDQDVISDWRKEAEDQTKETLSFFFDNYDKNAFQINAWICNQRQLTLPNFHQQIKAFKEETKASFKLKHGIVLKIQREIDLEKI